MTRYTLRRRKIQGVETNESYDYLYIIVEIIQESHLHSIKERNIGLVHDEESGTAIVKTLNEQRKEGVIEGVQRFAWWKDGEQFVGTCGTTLKKAVEEIKKEM